MAACSACNTRCLTTIRLVYTYSFWKKPLFSVTQYTIFIYFWHKFYRKHQSSIANNHSSTVFEKKKNKQTNKKKKKEKRKENKYVATAQRVPVFVHSRSGPYFPAFRLNTERYSVSLGVPSECGKIRTKKTPNTNTFYAVCRNLI